MRKHPLITNQIYHIFNKSIAGYKIFSKKTDYDRFIEMMKYYQNANNTLRFSVYYQSLKKSKYPDNFVNNTLKSVDIIAYCIMPTHIHLVLCQLIENGITKFMKNILDSYSRYFNIVNNRKGPLWQGRFKSVLVESDEQLLHLTRYVHLNPSSDNLVKSPEDWNYSSYREYLGSAADDICNFPQYIEINKESYKVFVQDRQDYQKKLAEIKHLLF